MLNVSGGNLSGEHRGEGQTQKSLAHFRYRNVLSPRDCPCMAMDTYSCMQNNEQSNIGEKKHIQPFYFSRERYEKRKNATKAIFCLFHFAFMITTKPVRVCVHVNSFCFITFFFFFFECFNWEGRATSIAWQKAGQQKRDSLCMSSERCFFSYFRITTNRIFCSIIFLNYSILP